MSNRYVYGIVENGEELEFETEAVADADVVYTVSHDDIAAVVSDIDTTDPERTDRDAQRHDEVLRELLERDDGRTVVPMQFGMAFEGDRALKNVLRGARPAFRSALRDVEGAVELGLKVVSEEGSDVNREQVAESVADDLDAIARESVEGERFSDRLVLNRSYLVDRGDREAFDEAIGRLDAEYDDLAFHYTGPFAPYNFVDVHVGGR